MKGGSNLLETRSINNSLDLKEFEEKLKLTFPTYYKLFLETFEVGENMIRKEHYILDGDLYPCSSYIYKPMSHIGFVNFLTPEMSCNVLNDLDESSHEKKNGLIPIGATGTSAIIYVGTSNDDSDKVFLEYENNWTFICSNVFEFVRGLEFWTREDDKDLKQTIIFSNLSRNWREDFWRAKADENNS